jgi:hypothetical protein
MLDERGRFGFTAEVLDLVQRLWCAYEQSEGQAQSVQARLLGLAYIVACLRQDVEGIWSQLLTAPELAGVDLDGALAQELGDLDGAAHEAIRAELQRQGWLTA